MSAIEETPGSTGTDNDPKGEASQLLAGLVRQKEDLGPIAEELIELLHHYGVPDPSHPGVGRPVH
jgi:hypothetical protein